MTASFTSRDDGEEPDARIVYISVANKNSMSLGVRCQEMSDLPAKLEITCCDSEDADASEEDFLKLLAKVRVCDFLILVCHGDESYFKKYGRVKDVVDRRQLNMFYTSALDELNEENRGCFRFPDEDYRLFGTLLDIGGDKNLDSAIVWLAKNIAGKDELIVPEPVTVRMQGLYRPGASEDITLEEYTKDFDPSKPTVGIAMHYSGYTKGRLYGIDKLLAELDRIGCNVICIYFNSYPNEALKSIGIKRCVETYFMKEGRHTIDSLIMTSGFSQITLSDPAAYSENRTIENFFIDLDIPVIQAPGISRSIPVWMEDTVGMSASDLNCNIIWPEFDGQIISVPLTFTESLGDGEYKTSSVPDRVERIAGLAKMWADLNRKPVKDRRVVIIFHMYPPSNDHLGGAAGLDTFASVHDLLHKMKNEGYTLDHLPEDSKAVVDEMFEGLTTDVEWTPDSELLERAADSIPGDMYEGWWNSLTDKAKAGIIHGWGEPVGEIMTYEGKILVPGRPNGNVFLGIQPNRGQHSQAERLYHDPFIVMPHAYLGYYRWIKYVYKADCVIHVGTHGTIEWLPGKGNGLSSSCYPDVVLDTMPNVYPYIIDDPGEGIQCKRRINSVLIGHMCPSMTRADGYDDIALLDGKLQELLHSEATSQESKADILGAEM